MLQSLSLYHTFQTVTDENNSLVMSTGTYLIPQGSYNGTTLLQQVNSLLTDAGITSSFDAGTLHFTFTHNEGTDFTIYNTSTCLGLLGFTDDDDHVSTDGVLTSDKVCNLSSPARALVHSSFYNQNIDSTHKQVGSTILASVLINVTYGSLISYTAIMPTWAEVGAQSIQSIQVWFTSSRDGSDLNLQSQDFDVSILLEITLPYYSDDTPIDLGALDQNYPAQ
jgi:hypothetical protein